MAWQVRDEDKTETKYVSAKKTQLLVLFLHPGFYLEPNPPGTNVRRNAELHSEIAKILNYAISAAKLCDFRCGLAWQVRDEDMTETKYVSAKERAALEQTARSSLPVSPSSS